MSDADLAFLALLAGCAGIARELCAPGHVIPGVLGLVCVAIALPRLWVSRPDPILMLAIGLPALLILGFLSYTALRARSMKALPRYTSHKD